ncbi:MAG: DUF2239 family protein [Caulobacterales bacterium]|nr:DUF2239 family protein [Caulobacterales bacterium]
MPPSDTFTAFLGARQLATGDLSTVARAAADADANVSIFNDATGHPVDLDLRFGPQPAVEAYLARSAPTEPSSSGKGRGRPRLGVVAREITLLPRHWQWLAAQPGGASATLRRLVEEARRATTSTDRHRQSRDALYRVMSALAGDLPGFEEASRALFAANDAAFDTLVTAWPADIAGYVRRLAEAERAARPDR